MTEQRDQGDEASLERGRRYAPLYDPALTEERMIALGSPAEYPPRHRRGRHNEYSRCVGPSYGITGRWFETHEDFVSFLAGEVS